VGGRAGPASSEPRTTTASASWGANVKALLIWNRRTDKAGIKCGGDVSASSIGNTVPTTRYFDLLKSVIFSRAARAIPSVARWQRPEYLARELARKATTTG